MKRIALLLLASAFMLCARAQTLTSISATSVNAGTGAVTGTLCLTAIDMHKNPISISTNGTFYIAGRPFCQTLSGGALTALLQVPNSLNDSSAGHAYDVQIYDSGSGIRTDLGAIYGIGGSAWSLGNYSPTVTTPTTSAFTFTTGSGSAPSSCTAPALDTRVNNGVVTISVCSGGVFVAANPGTIQQNLLLNAGGDLYVQTDSIGLILNGGFPEQLAAMLSVPVGQQHIDSIGGASMPDMLSCQPSSTGCSATSAYPYQVGSWPLAFPLGLASNDRVVLEAGFNDESNMGPTPSQNQLDYFAAGDLAWDLLFAIPDSQKLTPASCTTTGTWTAVSAVPGGSGTFPAGTIETTTPGATITCIGSNATAAGFIGYKSTGSTSATYSVAIANAGTTYNVTDSYTNSSTLNQTAYYTTQWSATANLAAYIQSGMSGGYTTMTLTAANNSSDPVIVVAPVFLSTSSSLQNAVALNRMLVSREGCNGVSPCAGISNHPDSLTNTLRGIQIANINTLRANGLNASYFDPNAIQTGFNSSDSNQTVKTAQFTVSAGGSGFSSAPTMTVTGCSINPTGHVTLSGSSVTTGTFYFDTTGDCNGGSPVISFSGGGGSGAVATASPTVNDGTHPNHTGAQHIADVALANFNSAAMVQDHFTPIVTSSFTGYAGCTSGATGAITCSNSANQGYASYSLSALGTDTFELGIWGTGNGAGLPGSPGLLDVAGGNLMPASTFVFNVGANGDLHFGTPVSGGNVAGGVGAFYHILHDGSVLSSAATAPTGSCTTNGAWMLSQDGHATVCLAGTWTSKI